MVQYIDQGGFIISLKDHKQSNGQEHPEMEWDLTGEREVHLEEEVNTCKGTANNQQHDEGRRESTGTRTSYSSYFGDGYVHQ